MRVAEPVADLDSRFSSEGATATGCNTIDEGLDVVVEGDALQVTDDAKLIRIADLYESKYGREWRFRVRDGVFVHEDGEGVALVFEVVPRKAFGFGKGSEFSQTRWRFHTEPA